ncbi:MAG: hypothetical protein LLF76_10690 [Planctomycetaceae bacterium]|nr:hypothetical protein [Planctomycetaceae bacterium]
MSIGMLARIQADQPAGYPYIFLPTQRYDHIQYRRQTGELQNHHRVCPVNNFTRVWLKILHHAGVRPGEFHDLRRTCLTNWLGKLSPYEVMHLAGHSDFETTQRFYLAVSTDLVEKARVASHANLDFGTRLSRAC